MQLSTKLTALITGVLAVLGMTLFAPAANAQPLTQGDSTVLACPDNDWQILDGRIGRFIRVEGARIRTGPSTACTALGLAYPSYTVQLDCTRAGWTHLFVYNTGVQGWVRNDLLTSPANRACQ